MKNKFKIFLKRLALDVSRLYLYLTINNKTMTTIEQAQNAITSNIQGSQFVNASDGVNLVMSAVDSDGLSLANIYKSFNERFQPIFIVRYVNPQY